MTYRHDIDGLRALAVLSVILFHSGISIISGGFIGVDVFFVISGYLITTLIYKETLEENFSFSSFYKRRAARLLPALAITLHIVLLFGFVFYNSKSFDNLGKEVFFSSFGAANILFSQGVNYFAKSTAYQPLIHLWSLGVEEQFYILWPVILLITFRISRNAVLPVACIMLALTFWLSVSAANARMTEGYFLLQYRAFELLIGAVIAIAPFSLTKLKVNEASRQLLSLIGIALVIAPMFLLDHNSSFPGVNALYPCLGTALIIAFPNKGLVTKLLSHKILVYIGLISYPLYLFHQPLISFLYFFEENISSAYVFLITTTISICLSWFTYTYIEKPIRKVARAKQSKKSFITIMGLVSLFPILAVMGIGIAKSNGLEERFRYLNPFALEVSSAHSTSFHQHFKRGFQVNNSTHGKALFIGDSVLQHYVYPLKQVLDLEFSQIDTVTRGGCVLLKEINFEDVFSDISCNDLRESLYKHKKKYDYVIISQAWNAYDSSVRNFPSSSGKYERWTPFLDETIKYFSSPSTKVIVIGAHPIVEGTLKLQPSILNNKENFEKLLKGVQITNKVDLEDSTHFFKKYRARVSVIHPYNIFCDNECVTNNQEWSYFSDNQHVSLAATPFLVERFRRLINETQ